MAAIEWSRLSSTTYEDMVACLLSHQNPRVRRIDGSGGDGGRDCQWDGPDGLHAYELKGFPGGRVGPTQRRQVERSLRRAGLLNPVDWTLVTPVDPTPQELAWFKKLGVSLPFPIEWRGRTWLDLEFSQRMFIADYYLGTTQAEVVELLRELSSENAALAGGMRDAIERFEKLVKRANSIDPHYRFRIESDGMTTRVTVIPAYVGAELDRPITVKANFRFDTRTEEGRAKEEEFLRSLDFGTAAELSGEFVPEVTVNAPAGLGGTYEGPTISLGPGTPVVTEPLDLVFTIVDPDGATVASLDMSCTPQSSGRRGTVMHGTHKGGHAEAEVIIDVADHKYRIHLRFNWESFVPHDFAPVARFLAAYHAPNRVVVSQADGAAPSDPFDCGAGFVVPDWLVEFVTSLAIIQAATGIVREVVAISVQDVANALGAANLLRGAEAHVRWTSATVTVAAAPLEMRRQMAANSIRQEMVVDAPYGIDVCGTLYPLGHRHIIGTVARVDPGDVEALMDEASHGDIRVGLGPDPAEPLATIRLVE